MKIENHSRLPIDFYWFSISINLLLLIFIDYYWSYWLLILIEWYGLARLYGYTAATERN